MQYVVLRRDLWADLGWPLGSVVAQACHAATAALWLSREEPATFRYCAAESIDHMHKVPIAIAYPAAFLLLEATGLDAIAVLCHTALCNHVSTERSLRTCVS